MKVRDLEIFLAVAESGSFTKASEKLYLAQPSVSRTIKQLEDLYGVQLFERFGKKTLLTEAGETFLYHARRMIHEKESLEEAMKDHEKTLHLRIGSSLTIGTYILPQVVRLLQEKSSSIKFSVQVENSQSIIRKIKENLLDVGIIEIPSLDSSIDSKVILRDRLVPVCSPKYHLDSHRIFSWQELTEEPLLLREKGSAGRDLLDERFRNMSGEPTVLMESSTNESLVSAARENLGVAVLSHFIVEPSIKLGLLREIKMEGEPFLRTFHLIWHKDKYMKEEMKEALSFIEKEMGKWM